jgi:hypothetical protein
LALELSSLSSKRNVVEVLVVLHQQERPTAAPKIQREIFALRLPQLNIRIDNAIGFLRFAELIGQQNYR